MRTILAFVLFLAVGCAPKVAPERVAPPPETCKKAYILPGNDGNLWFVCEEGLEEFGRQQKEREKEQQPKQKDLGV